MGAGRLRWCGARACARSTRSTLCTRPCLLLPQVVSVGFELLELSLRHMLPNFNECWYDSWVLDVAVCNVVGIVAGMATVRWLDCKYERCAVTGCPAPGQGTRHLFIVCDAATGARAVHTCGQVQLAGPQRAARTRGQSTALPGPARAAQLGAVQVVPVPEPAPVPAGEQPPKAQLVACLI